MATSQTFSLIAFTFSLLAVTSTVHSHNITKILATNPDYSSFNSYLSQTKLSDEINSRMTITVLVVNNAGMSSIAGKHPLSVIKSVLSLHVLLDYYDFKKLQHLSQGVTTLTTLYQTTGEAIGNEGLVNITKLKGGKVRFTSAASNSKLDSSYIKSIKQIPYNISVLEIDAPIIAPGVLTTVSSPSSAVTNITVILEKNGCKTFADLLASSGVLKTYESAVKTGLTVFAPSDEAFGIEDVPDLTKLTQAEVVSLLEYHALAEYKPKGSLKTNRNNITTLATNGARKFDLTTSASGDEVTLHTGVDSSRLATTVIDSTPVVIFTVDNVLLPIEIFGKSSEPPVLEPAPEDEPSPLPSPEEEPSPDEDASSPSDYSPDGAPSDSPTDSPIDSENTNSAAAITSPSLFTAWVTLAAVTVTVPLCS